MSEELINAIANMQEDQVLELTNQLLANGTDPLAILDDCQINPNKELDSVNR